MLRFVERLEYQNDPELHELFIGRIDRAKREYEEVTDKLLARQKEGSVMFNTVLILRQVAPILFSDYEIVKLPDGTGSVKTLYPKV